MASSRSTQLPKTELAVAERLRDHRQRQRFTQKEVADMVGATRAMVSNIEYGLARLPFSIGYEYCRRLDLSMRWLATGKEPLAPFVGPDELGVTQQQMDGLRKRGVGFLEIYKELFSKALDSWFAAASPAKLIERTVRQSPQAVARSMSLEQLMENIPQLVDVMKRAPVEHRFDYVVMAAAQINELRERLEAERGR